MRPGQTQCHPGRRHKGHGLCLQCYRRWARRNIPGFATRRSEQQRKWRLRNRESLTIKKRAYQELVKARPKPRIPSLCHPERPQHTRGGECKTCYTKKRYSTDRAFTKQLKTKYGLPRAVYEAMWVRQDGRCAICRDSLVRGRAHTDHCHATGVVRGILCKPCNHGLGFFRDDPEILRDAAAYAQHAIAGHVPVTPAAVEDKIGALQ